MLPKAGLVTDSNDQCVLEMGAVETKFFQFLLTEEERKDDSKKESKWKLPGEEEILRKMQSSESDMSAHLQKNLNPNKQWDPVLPTTRLLYRQVRAQNFPERMPSIWW